MVVGAYGIANLPSQCPHLPGLGGIAARISTSTIKLAMIEIMVSKLCKITVISRVSRTPAAMDKCTIGNYKSGRTRFIVLHAVVVAIDSGNRNNTRIRGKILCHRPKCSLLRTFLIRVAEPCTNTEAFSQVELEEIGSCSIGTLSVGNEACAFITIAAQLLSTREIRNRRPCTK